MKKKKYKVQMQKKEKNNSFQIQKKPKKMGKKLKIKFNNKYLKKN